MGGILKLVAGMVVSFGVAFFAALQVADLSTPQGIKVGVVSAAISAVAHLLPSALGITPAPK